MRIDEFTHFKTGKPSTPTPHLSIMYRRVGTVADTSEQNVSSPLLRLFKSLNMNTRPYHLSRMLKRFLSALALTPAFSSYGQAEMILSHRFDLVTQATAYSYTPFEEDDQESKYDPISSTSLSFAFQSTANASTTDATAFGRASAEASRIDASSGRILLKTLGTGISEPNPYTGPIYPLASSSGQSEVNVQLRIEPGTQVPLHIAWAKRGNQTFFGNFEVRASILDNGFSLADSGSDAGLTNTADGTFNISARVHSGDFGPHNSEALIVWSVGKSLPGISRDDAWDREDLPADIPVEVSGAYFRTPVVAGYGLDESVFFQTVAQDVASGGFLAGDGLFQSDGIAFSSVVLPTAVPELGYYTLQFDQFPNQPSARAVGLDSLLQAELDLFQIQLAPGSIFDFTTLNPNGVHSFELLGLGQQALNDPSLVSNYVTGLKFSEEGLGSFRYQLTSIPEPGPMSFLIGAAITFMTLNRRRNRKGESEKPGCGRLRPETLSTDHS